MFSDNDLKRIIKEGQDTELWEALIQIFESEREDILEKIDDLELYPNIDRPDLIRKRNYLKWIITLPERMTEKWETKKEDDSDPYQK